MRVLRAIRCKDSSWWHRLAVDRFDDAHLIRTNFDQRELTNNFLERPFDQVESRLEDVRLNADFAFRRDHTAGRHLRAQIASLLDCDLACADVHEYSSEN